MKGSSLLKWLIIVSLLLIILKPDFLYGGQMVAILKSADTPDYNAVRNGFISAFFGEHDEFDCGNDINRAKRNIAIIKAEGFDIILAIGNLAMTTAIEEASDLMIIGTMIPNPDIFDSASNNMSIIGMYPPLNSMFDRLRSLGISNLGILYNPAENAEHIERLRAIANTKNINLITQEVNAPRIVPTAFQQIQEQIDGFLFLSDTIYSIRDSIDFIIQASNQNRIITIAPTMTLVRQGAVISISVDLVEIGRTAAQKVTDHFDGKSLSLFSDPPSLFISYNEAIANSIGINIPTDIQREAKEVVR